MFWKECKMKKTYIFAITVIIISLILAFSFYSKMPEQMASHWNSKGEVDGYMSKFLGLFLFPFILIALFLLFLLIPHIDPLKKNIEKFRKYFDIFILLMILFLFYIKIHLLCEKEN